MGEAERRFSFFVCVLRLFLRLSTRRSRAGTPGQNGLAAAERARRGRAGTPPSPSPGHAGEERTRRGGAGMTQRSVNTGAGASTPRQSGHTAAERARRGGTGTPERGGPAAALTFLPTRPLPRFRLLPFARPPALPLPAAAPLLPSSRSRPHALAQLAPPNLRPPRSPGPTSGSRRRILCSPPPSRCPLTPPPPTLPGSLSLPPNTPTPAALPLHVHARCAHAREFSHTLFARLKK